MQVFCLRHGKVFSVTVIVMDGTKEREHWWYFAVSLQHIYSANLFCIQQVEHQLCYHNDTNCLRVCLYDPPPFLNKKYHIHCLHKFYNSIVFKYVHLSAELEPSRRSGDLTHQRCILSANQLLAVDGEPGQSG